LSIIDDLMIIAYGPLTSINKTCNVDISSSEVAGVILLLSSMRHKFLVLTEKNWLKSAYILRKLSQNQNRDSAFWTTL